MPLRAPRPLDDVDHALLRLLTNDGRVSTRALAASIDVTEATAASRLRRLQDDGILTITCVFDRVAAGYEWFGHVAVTVAGRSPRAVAEDLALVPGVVGSAVVWDGADVVAGVAAADRPSFSHALTTAIPMVKGVADMFTDIELECLYHTWGYATLPAAAPQLHFPNPVVELDELDLRIIDDLVRDGRQSNREIGRHLEVSESTVRSRVRRLDEAGLMRIVAQVDPAAAGLIGTLANVGVNVEGVSARDVADWMMAQPETAMCSLTTGKHQVRWVVATPTRDRLVELVNDELRGLPGVRRAQTFEMTDRVSHVYQWVRFV